MLTAKKINIQYNEVDHDRVKQSYQYCWEFSNGLIMFESETTASWFFPCRESIELCGHDILLSITETEDCTTFEKREFQGIVSHSVREFGVNSECKKLIFELVKNAAHT